MAFSFQGMSIEDPYKDETGRDTVDPVSYYYAKIPASERRKLLAMLKPADRARVLDEARKREDERAKRPPTKLGGSIKASHFAGWARSG